MKTLTNAKDFEDTIVTYLKSGETNRPLIVFGQNSNTKEESAKKAFNQLGKGYYRWDYMCARKPEQEQWERAIEKQASVLIDMPYMEQPIMEDDVLNDFLQDRGLSVVLLLRSTKEEAMKVVEKYGDTMQYAFYEVAASKRIHIVYEPEFDSFMPAPILDLTFESDNKQLTCQFKDDGREIEAWKTMQLHPEDKEDLIDFLSDNGNVERLFEAKVSPSSSRNGAHYEDYKLLVEDGERRNIICTGKVNHVQMPFDIIAENYRYGHRIRSLRDYLEEHPFVL